MNDSDIYMETFRSGDYIGLTSRKPPWSDGTSELSSYVYLRAYLVLGEYALVESHLRDRDNPPIGEFARSLLTAQLRGERESRPKAVLDNLLTWKITTDTPDLLVAEYFFTLGFLANRLCKFEVGLGYGQLAITRYEEAGFPIQKGLAIFNAFSAASFIGRHDIAHAFFTHLQDLDTRHHNPVLHQHLLRLKAYCAMAAKDYPAARQHLEQALALSLKQHRYLNVLSTATTLAYVLAKLDNTAAFLELSQTIATIEDRTDVTSFKDRIKVMRTIIADHPVIDISTWRRFQKSFSGMDGITRIYLTDLLLDRIERHRDFSLLLQTATSATTIAAKVQQKAPGVEFLRYRIRALIELFHLDQAEKELHSFKTHAESEASWSVNATFIEKSLKQIDELRRKHLSPPDCDILINPATKSITAGSSTHDLSKKTKVFDYLRILMDAHPAAISIDKLFAALYQDQYCPFRHEARMHSLFIRARRLLPEKDWLYRHNAEIHLKTSLVIKSAAIRLPKLGNQQSNMRRRAIVEFASRHSKSFALSDVSRAFPVPERTLQRDLGILVSRKIFVRTGNTSDTTYKINQEQK